MDIAYLTIGRLKGPEQELSDRYFKRIGALGRSLGIGRCSLATINEGRGGTAKARQKTQAEALLKKCPDNAVVVALDERGKTLDSLKFSELIATIRDRGTMELVFVVGGPDGHGEALLRRADFKLSLSAMTMPHGLARVVLFEQVYRALTILANHPYHRQ